MNIYTCYCMRILCSDVGSSLNSRNLGASNAKVGMVLRRVIETARGIGSGELGAACIYVL